MILSVAGAFIVCLHFSFIFGMDVSSKSALFQMSVSYIIFRFVALSHFPSVNSATAWYGSNVSVSLIEYEDCETGVFRPTNQRQVTGAGPMAMPVPPQEGEISNAFAMDECAVQ